MCVILKNFCQKIVSGLQSFGCISVSSFHGSWKSFPILSTVLMLQIWETLATGMHILIWKLANWETLPYREMLPNWDIFPSFETLPNGKILPKWKNTSNQDL
jgi:hypothetical protein